jgi:hypothetical protein
MPCRRFGLKTALIAFSAALILAFAGILAQSAYRTHRQIVGDAATAAESIARSAETNTGRTILSIDAMLAGIGQSVASTHRDMPLDGPEVRTMLRRMNEQTLSVRDILIIDERGRQVNGVDPTFSRSRSYADRDFFTANRGDELSSLFIGRTDDRASGPPSLFMGRPLGLSDGFRGFVIADVPVETFADIFASIVPNGGLHVTLMFEDGTIVVGEPNDAPATRGRTAIAEPCSIGFARTRRRRSRCRLVPAAPARSSAIVRSVLGR